MFKHNRLLATTLSLLVVLICIYKARAVPINADDYKETIRVACVGDSITYGSGVKDRENNNYPTQLGRMLGAKWEVKNFGVSATTLLRKGDKPYYKENAYTQALEFKPDVLVIKLGTNDSKHPVEGADNKNVPNNWQYKDDFVADYKALIGEFKKVNPNVKVYICLPVPAFPGRWGINGSTIKEEVVPLTRQVAAETEATPIDLYSAFINKPELLPDTVHPNAQGATLIATEVYRALTGKEPVEGA